jgi:hypothetical protein
MWSSDTKFEGNTWTGGPGNKSRSYGHMCSLMFIMHVYSGICMDTIQYIYSNIYLGIKYKYRQAV